MCHVNFENYKTAGVESFVARLNNHLTDQWGLLFDKKNLADIFEQIDSLKNEKCVLIIDEVEGINPEFFGTFLHSIRNAYHSRTEKALKSVILVGVSNLDKDF